MTQPTKQQIQEATKWTNRIFDLEMGLMPERIFHTLRTALEQMNRLPSEEERNQALNCIGSWMKFCRQNTSIPACKEKCPNGICSAAFRTILKALNMGEEG